MILMLGDSADESIQHMSKALSQRNIGFITLNSKQFATKMNFNYSPNSDQGRLQIGPHSIQTNCIKSVLWIRVYPPIANPLNNYLNLSPTIVQQEVNCFLQSFLNLEHISWCNSWQAYQLHKTKPRQLRMAKNLGANIPDTVIGNTSNEKHDFLKSRKCIDKPIHGGYLTRLIDKSELSKNAGFPSTIQVLIEGLNIRTYLIGHFEFSARIDTTNIDFRSDHNVKVNKITLPTKVRQLAFRIMNAFDMQWTAIDWILNEKLEYVFLEANPAPLFVEFEKATGYPITESIISMLMTIKNE